jgi:hypothetical protein
MIFHCLQVPIKKVQFQILNLEIKEVEDEEASEEESDCPDYFMNIIAKKHQSAVQVPPQNYIKPKNKGFFRDKKKFKTSFRMKKKEAEASGISFDVEYI